MTGPKLANTRKEIKPVDNLGAHLETLIFPCYCGGSPAKQKRNPTAMSSRRVVMLKLPLGMVLLSSWNPLCSWEEPLEKQAGRIKLYKEDGAGATVQQGGRLPCLQWLI